MRQGVTAPHCDLRLRTLVALNDRKIVDLARPTSGGGRHRRRTPTISDCVTLVALNDRKIIELAFPAARDRMARHAQGVTAPHCDLRLRTLVALKDRKIVDLAFPGRTLWANEIEWRGLRQGVTGAALFAVGIGAALRRSQTA